MSKIETRNINSQIETRYKGEDEEKQRFVTGMGAVYNQETEIFPWLREQIRPGAFADSLNDGHEIKSYFNHDADRVLATTLSNPALEIEDTADGLRFTAPIPPTTYGGDLEINLDRGNVRGASFAFRVVEDIITEDHDSDMIYREITKAEIYELGPVTNPAYPGATVEGRSKDDIAEEVRERLKEKAPKRGNVDRYKREIVLTERGV